MKRKHVRKFFPKPCNHFNSEPVGLKEEEEEEKEKTFDLLSGL